MGEATNETLNRIVPQKNFKTTQAVASKLLKIKNGRKLEAGQENVSFGLGKDSKTKKNLEEFGNSKERTITFEQNCHTDNS